MDKLADVVVNQNANIESLFQLKSLAREKRLRKNQKVLQSRDYSKHLILPPFCLEDWVLW